MKDKTRRFIPIAKARGFHGAIFGKKLVGKAAIIDKDNVTFGAFMAVFRSNFNPYILAVINSPYFRQMLAGDVGTMTINQITQNMLKNFLVPLPPLKEQKRIVAKLEELMPLLERLDAAEKKLSALDKAFPDKLKKSILQAAIQGKLSKQLPTDGNAIDLLADMQAERSKLIKQKKIKTAPPLPPISPDEIPFDIPENWQWVRLGDIFNVHSGQNLTQKQMSKSGYPVYGGNGITGFHDKKLIDKDSLVIGRVGFYCGSVHKVIQDCWVTDNALIVNFFDEKSICKDFFVYLLRYSNLKNLSVATAQPVISGKRIYQKIIPLPPLAEQKRIVAKLEELLPLCDKLAEKISK